MTVLLVAYALMAAAAGSFLWALCLMSRHEAPAPAARSHGGAPCSPLQPVRCLALGTEPLAQRR